MKRPSQSVGSFHFPHQRILITGANGAGKSWLARLLAQRLGLPWVNNDALALGTGWAYRDKPQIVQSQAAAIAQDSWVLDGGPSLVRPDILARVDAVIWLDPPVALRVWRVLRRTLRYMGRNRPEHPRGNIEWPGRRQVRFIYKTWANDAQVRSTISAGVAGMDVIRIRSSADLRRFLQN